MGQWAGEQGQRAQVGPGESSHPRGGLPPRAHTLPDLPLTTMPSVERRDSSMSVVICGRWGARLSPISPDKAANRLYLGEAGGSCIVLLAVARLDGGAWGTHGPEREVWVGAG